MYVRLGFAVAVHTEPDVLLVDEVLAVGDEAFAHRGLRRIEELLAGGSTVVFVSHSLSLVESVCDARGMARPRQSCDMIGDPRRVVDAYRQAVAEEEGERHRMRKEERAQRDAASPVAEVGGEEALRWGSRAAEVAAARLRGAAGDERYHFVSGEPLVVEIDVRAAAPLDDFVFGVAIATPRGFEVWGTNTELAGYRPTALAGEARVRLVCPELRLAAGDYQVDVAVHARDGAPYDYRRRLLSFAVTASDRGVGVYAPPHQWEFEGGAHLGGPEET
jgi:lipopolysaccharide transport system ATP-binding protein